MTTRISFRQAGGGPIPRPPVPPSTTRYPETGRRRGPRLLLLVLCSALAGLVGIAWYRSVNIHTYGVVATGMELFHAPVRSTMVAIHVEPGDEVEADQLLFVLRSDESAAELAQMRTELERAEIAMKEEQAHGEQADPLRTRDLQAAAGRVQQVERAILRLDADRQQASLDRGRRVQELQLLLASEESQLRCVQERREVLHRLLRHGAATRAELSATDADHLARQLRIDTTAEQIAGLQSIEREATERHALERSRLQEEWRSAEENLVVLQAEYDEVSKRRADQRGQVIADLRGRIAGLHARMEHLQMLAGPTEVRALADGVVMEVALSVGSTVAKDGIIMSVAGTGKSWINAFVEARDSGRLSIGQRVRIYPSAGGGPLPGRVSGGGGLEYKVHPALRDRIDAFSAVYARIDLDGGGEGLIPGNVVEVVIE